MNQGFLKKIVYYELRLLAADRLTHLVILFFVAVTGFAVSNGFTGLREANQKAQSARESQEKLFENVRNEIIKEKEEPQNKEDAGRLPKAGKGYAALLWFDLSDFSAAVPPNGFSASAVGLRRIVPQSYYFEKYRDDAANLPTVENRSLNGVFAEKIYVNPLHRFVGSFDLAFVTLYITPLFILVFCFNLVAGEKDSGVLALLLSHPVSVKKILIGKIIVRVVLIFIPAAILPSLAIYLGHRFYLMNSSISLWLIWLVATGLYCVFWVALAVFVNSFKKSAAVNALVLSSCWVVIAILLPAAIQLFAALIYPLYPSTAYNDAAHRARIDGNARMTKIYNAYDKEFKNRTAGLGDDEVESHRITEQLSIPQTDSLLSEYLERNPQIPRNLLFYQLYHTTLTAREEAIEAKLAPILTEINSRRLGQQLVSESLGIISPTFGLREVLFEIAGTGESRNRLFLAQFDGYVRDRNRFFLNEILANRHIPAEEFGGIPKFTFSEESLTETVKRIFPTLSIVSLWTVLLIWGTTLRFKDFRLFE